MKLTIQEVIAVVGVLTAFLTALVSLIGLRWNKQALEAKDAQLGSLKQQLDALRDRTPAELQKQMVALKDLMESEVSRLQKSLEESNDLLRRKSAEVSDEKRAIGTMLGYGRLFFGIDDGELLVRRLHELLYTRSGPIEYGEQELATWSFYLNAVRLVMPNDDACAGIVTGNPEWMLDYLIIPLLACMRFRSLKRPAREVLDRVCTTLESTPFTHEVPIYREAIERAEGGFDFLAGHFPRDLQMRMIQSKKNDA
jgi:hypothetical protein